MPLRRLLVPLVGLLLVGGLAVGASPPVAAAPRLPTPAGWPLSPTATLLRGFDAPDNRYGRGHRGVDLAAQPGATVRAAVGGRVAFAGQVAGRGVVSIDRGGYRTTYEPVSPRVRRGEPVGLGQAIGTVATGGHCASSCLHWGLRRGEDYLDPLLLVTRDAPQGPLRLLAADQREVAERRARERAEAARAAAGTAPGAIGPGGRYGFARPVPGPITSAFGMRFHPVLRRWKLHEGTDFAAACGTPIRAPSAGTVRQVSFDGAYGNRLFLAHGAVDGREVVTAYNHATGYVVRPGERVTRGQLLGHVGTTGYSTGCHLHLMVWLDGRLVDPMTWF